MEVKKRTTPRQYHWCPLPWTAIETTPNGEARVCCLSNTLVTRPDGSAYNLQTDSLQEVFQSDYMKSLRQAFLDGKKPSTCNKCWSVEEAGGKSKRILARDSLEYKKVFEPIDYFNIDPVIIRLVFVLSFFVGAGPIVYIVAWLIIPERKEE